MANTGLLTVSHGSGHLQSSYLWKRSTAHCFGQSIRLPVGEVHNSCPFYLLDEDMQEDKNGLMISGYVIVQHFLIMSYFNFNIIT